jgi:DNA polymerase III subunit delta
VEFKDIIQSIRKKDYKPVYFLHGEESYYIDAITEVIENEVLDESMKSFNQTILYGKDIDFQTVVDNARRYPMMSQYQVVIIKEAQDMKTLAQLQSYIEKPLDSTVLCIAHKHKKLDMRTAFAKAIVKNAVVFEGKPLYENQVPDFIRNWLKDNEMTINQEALNLTVDYLGTDLGKIINELEKLKLNLKTKETITPEHIEKYIGISREYNIFELQKAIGTRDILKANRIIQYFAQNPKDAPLVVIISSLYGYFSKLFMFHFVKDKPVAEQVKIMGLRSDWFLKEYQASGRHFSRSHTEGVITLLKEYDLKSKGVNSDSVADGELLKELVYKILH